MTRKRAQAKIRIGQRDHAILRLVYEYRFLSRELIWWLLTIEGLAGSAVDIARYHGRDHPGKYGFGRHALNKRLKQLYDRQLLTRHYIADQPTGRGYGAPKTLYGLGSASDKLLEKAFGIARGAIRKIIKGNRVGSPFLRHALEIARFRVILTVACHNSAGRIRLISWQQGTEIKDHVYGPIVRGHRQRFTVYADAFFCIEVEGKRKHFFLEVDRGTEPVASAKERTTIRGKLQGYELYRKSKKLSKRHRDHIQGFQVLIVTSGMSRPGQAPQGRVANILDEIAANRHLYKSRSLFLLTTFGMLDLSVADSIFDRIWLSPKNPRRSVSLIG